ncbi:MAG: hypothetical protein IKG47_05090 [Oscillospiraceae bacterium]|nr:hypothetical protein [Oscillospiraceae bacterium]
MGQVIKLKKRKKFTGVTHRYKYKGVKYEVSSVFRPFNIISNDGNRNDDDGLKDRFTELVLHDPELTMQIKDNKICTMYSILSAGKESNADKI